MIWYVVNPESRAVEKVFMTAPLARLYMAREDTAEKLVLLCVREVTGCTTVEEEDELLDGVYEAVNNPQKEAH